MATTNTSISLVAGENTNRNHERKESKVYTVEDRYTFNKQRADAYKNQKEGKASNTRDPMIQRFQEGKIQKIINLLGKDKETATNGTSRRVPAMYGCYER